MTPPTKILIVGAGGIGCQLIPCLATLYDLVIVDGDSYEPKNSTRQFPALASTANKAETLRDIVSKNTTKTIEAIPEYVKGMSFMNQEKFQGVDMLIAAVDNHKARRDLMDIADANFIPCILGANEEEMGEAHLFIPGEYDPREHFVFEGGAPAPYACNSDESIETSPQTLLANFLAAGAIVHLLLSYQRVNNPLNCICHSRAERVSSSHRRVRDLLATQ